VQVNTGFEFGWLIRLLQTNRVILSASADVSNNSFTVVDIDQFVRDIIARIPDPQLTDHVPTVRGTGGLRFAWGVSGLFGLTALFEGGYGDVPRRAEGADFLYRTGATLDFDLGAVSPVPIGIGLSYSQTSVVSQMDVDSDEHVVVLRLGYTGRPDFIIGLDVGGSTVRDLNVSGTVQTIGAALTMRYYF